MTVMRKQWFFNISLFIVSSIIAILLLEGILRLIEYKDPPNFAAAYRYYFRPDHEAGYDIQENFPKTAARIEDNYFYEYWSNDLGCFDNPYQDEKDYVLLLGDSFAHMFTPYEEKWGTVLEKLLETRVLKCGVVGYGTKQEYIKAKKVIARVKSPPKLIVLGYFINDYSEDYVFPSSVVLNGFLVSSFRISDLATGVVEMKSEAKLYEEIKAYEKNLQQPQDIPHAVWFWIVNNSLLHAQLNKIWKVTLKNFFDYRVKNDSALYVNNQNIPRFELLYGFLTLPEKKYPWLQRAWETHYKNLISFKRLAETHSARLLVVIIPTKEQIYFPERLADQGVDPAVAINKLCAFLKRENFEYLDLAPFFRDYIRSDYGQSLDPERDLYWKKDGHWSIKGNHLAGLLVAEHIIRNNLINVPQRDEKLRKIAEDLNTLRQ
jgi:hypothetical protein